MKDKNDNNIPDKQEFWIAVSFAIFFALIGTISFIMNGYVITGGIITVFTFALGLIGGEEVKNYFIKRR